MESDAYTDHSKYPILEHIAVPEDMRTAWQDIVDLISEIFQVPAALIMRVHERDIEVYVQNRVPATPTSPDIRNYWAWVSTAKP